MAVEEKTIVGEVISDVSADKSKISLGIKVFAGLILLVSALNIASSTFAVIVYVQQSVSGEYYSLGLSTIVCELLHLICASLLAISLCIFSIMLLKNHRRYAALFIYYLYVLIGIDLISTFMLYGIGWNLIVYVLGLSVLIPLQVYLDPALQQERELQRKLRDAETRTQQIEGTLGLDKSGKGFIDINFFNLFWIFGVASIVGLVAEELYHYFVVVPGEWQDRAGLLFGPFSPIYGFGAVLMTVGLNKLYKHNLFLIFILSAFIGGAFEVLASYFMEYMYGGVAWNYSDQPLSFCGGRTCAFFMFLWGCMGVFWLKACLPVLVKMLNKIPWNLRYSLTLIATIFMLIDCIMTLQSLDCWYMRQANDPSGIQSTPISQFYAKNFDDDYMQKRFASMSIDVDAAVRTGKV